MSSRSYCCLGITHFNMKSPKYSPLSICSYSLQSDRLNISLWSKCPLIPEDSCTIRSPNFIS